MEYKDFFEKALSGAEQKYPCSEIETALGNITERAKKSEQSSEPGQLHTASEPAHKPSNRFFPILGYTVGAAALIFGCVFGLKIVIENGGLKEGGPESADSNVTTAVTSEIPETTTVTSSDTSSANDNTDISQMLDTSMPENPFDLPPVGDYEGLEYYVESYVFRFDNIDSHITDLVDRDELVEWINEHEQEKLKMGYGIEPLTVLAFVEKFGITKEQLTEAAKLMRDDKYTKEFALMDEDIDIIYSGDKKKIIEHFRAEYAVLGSDRAYSPMWLYEHTAEAYKAAGIDPRDILDILPAYEKMFRYNERNMNDEAWRAFLKKLTLYGDRAFYDESSIVKTYTFETDISEPFGDRAFEILENQFYGEWELVGSPYGLLPTISFTYSKDAFVHEGPPVTGIYETDEIYVIAFSNYGVSACYFIEKNDPNTMYYMSDLTSEFGITVVNCFKNNMQYTRSEGNSEAPELKTGEISVLGLEKLEHLYGKDFETFLEVTMESDGYDDIEGRGEYYLWNVYNAGKPEWYLVDMSDSAVTLRVPYVTDRSGSEQTPVYLDLRFTKDDTGEWSVGYSPAEKDEKNPYGLTLEVKDATAYSQDNSKPNNAASDEVVDFLANIEQLVNSSEQIEELKQLLLKIEGVADVQVYNSDDDS
ncbi:MAG: hypothetical protein J6N15_08970, partial [Ruminiclostridium sp.]|nr:hypothetical protein [Ruminiclostridium sp.]